eukprot:symbB.v1.2.017609.t1/scaffold1377.1/size122625/2
MQRAAVCEVQRVLTFVERHALQMHEEDKEDLKALLSNSIAEAEALGCARSELLKNIARCSSHFVKTCLDLKLEDGVSPAAEVQVPMRRPVLTRISASVSFLKVERLQFHFKDGSQKVALLTDVSWLSDSMNGALSLALPSMFSTHSEGDWPPERCYSLDEEGKVICSSKDMDEAIDSNSVPALVLRCLRAALKCPQGYSNASDAALASLIERLFSIALVADCHVGVPFLREAGLLLRRHQRLHTLLDQEGGIFGLGGVADTTVSLVWHFQGLTCSVSPLLAQAAQALPSGIRKRGSVISDQFPIQDSHEWLTAEVRKHWFAMSNAPAPKEKAKKSRKRASFILRPVRPRNAPGTAVAPLRAGRERIIRQGQEPIVRRGRLNLAHNSSLARSLSAPRGATPVRFTAPGLQRGSSRRNISVGPQRQRRGLSQAPEEPSEDWCYAYYLAAGLNLKALHQRWLRSLRQPSAKREESRTVIRFNDDVMLLKVDEKDCFVFSFGCLVCWGCTPQEVGAARDYVQAHLAKPVELAQVEVDFLSITGNASALPIATKAVDRLAIAYSLAQSVRLSYWEQRIDLWVAATRLEVNDCMASASAASAADGAMPEDMDTASDPNGEEPKSDDSSDSSSSSSDSESYDDEEQRKLAYVLRLNRSCQAECRRLLAVLKRQKADDKRQIEMLDDFIAQRKRRPRPPAHLRIKIRPSFFSHEKRPRAPTKNPHALQRRSFFNNNNIKLPGRKPPGPVWKKAADASLIDVVRAELQSELFYQAYTCKAKEVPYLERTDFFNNVKKSIAEKSTVLMWSELNYKADWHRIAARMAKRGHPHPAKQCFVRYLHKLHPQLKKGKFTKQEDAALLQLSARYEGFDWDTIAKHMPTGRTAWTCFSRYQKSLNNAITKVGFSTEQMDLLRRSVRELGYFHDDPDRRSLVAIVSRLGPGKVGPQVEEKLQRFKLNIYQIPSLPWSRKEHRSLELAIKIYPPGCNDWKAIGHHVPDQDVKHLQRRWRDCQCRIGPWTEQEDQALRKSVEKHKPGNWNLMTWDVPTRSSKQIFRRWQKLFPKEGRLYEALQQRFGQRFRKRPTLVASDFAVNLQVEESVVLGTDIKMQQLTTGDQRADQHLGRINKLLRDTAFGRVQKKQNAEKTEKTKKRPAGKKGTVKKETVKKDNVKKENVKKEAVKEETVKKRKMTKENVQKETVKEETVKKRKMTKENVKKENTEEVKTEEGVATVKIEPGTRALAKAKAKAKSAAKAKAKAKAKSKSKAKTKAKIKSEKDPEHLSPLF